MDQLGGNTNGLVEELSLQTPVDPFELLAVDFFILCV